jgi:flagellar assembly factor FliW
MTPVAVWAGPTGERRDLPATLRVVEAGRGRPGHDEFVLDPLDDIGVLFALRSTAPAPIRLFVVSPRAFFPDYAPPLDPEVVAALAGAAGSQGSAPDPAVLVIVHPAQDDEPPTANLLAPLVVDAATGAAVQTVLEGSEWPLRAPLVAPAA